MKYELEIAEDLDKKFNKIVKKHRKLALILNKKINQIQKNPYHFKPLRGDMKGSRRVHIEKSFVLIYEIDENKKTIKLLDFNHHDKIY